MEFVNQPLTEQGGVQFGAAFAGEAFDLPMLPQPGEGGGEIKLITAADMDVVREPLEAAEAN